MKASLLPETVMFTIATAGYVPFTLNLHASLQKIGLGNQLVVYTTDRSVQRQLSSMGVRSLRFGRQRYQRWGDFQTPEFAKIVAYKWAVASEILSTGSNVLFVDSDIVFLKNPAQHLKDAIEKTSAHLIMQFESPKNVYNTGFWFARPEPLVLGLFKDIQHMLIVDKTFNADQQYFNEIARQSDEIRIHALDVELFACGNQFLGSIAIARPGEIIDRSSNPFPFDSAYLLHFNYMIGKERKVAAIKKYNAVFYPGLLTACNEKPSLWSRLCRRIQLSPGSTRSKKPPTL